MSLPIHLTVIDYKIFGNHICNILREHREGDTYGE